jgi:hypothetical protein
MRTRWRVIRLMMCCAATGLSGMVATNCVPNTFPQSGTLASKPDPYFCSEVSTGARNLSVVEVVLGWSAAVLGTAATATGAVILPLHTPSESTGEKMESAGMTTAGVVLGALSYMFFERGQAAGQLAEQADDTLADMQDPGGAGSDTDLDGSGWTKMKLWTAIGKCNRAIATWEGTRSNPNEYSKAVAKQQKAQAKIFQSTSLSTLDALYFQLCEGSNATNASNAQCTAIETQIQNLGGASPPADAGTPDATAQPDAK